MKIPISEIFFSLQWEWRNVWKPSIFVRFWGCNLKCTWCDSKYSWDATVEKATMMELDEVIQKIRSFKCSHIIFTGGEPSLYQDQMKIIMKMLMNFETDDLDFTYELETNWTKLIDLWWFNQVNISPKLSNSWNENYIIEALWSPFLLNTKTQVDFKFVVSTINDLKEVQNIIDQHKDFIHYKDAWIYLMPLWRDFESQMNKIVMDYCMKKGYNFCMRSHLVRFWDKKWV